MYRDDVRPAFVTEHRICFDALSSIGVVLSLSICTTAAVYRAGKAARSSDRNRICQEKTVERPRGCRRNVLLKEKLNKLSNGGT